jgi:hypothetical protein
MRKELHPIIRKYWEDQGYELKIDDTEFQVVRAFGNGVFSRTVGGIYYDVYWLAIGSPVKDTYTEKQFLQVLKLKAFL